MAGEVMYITENCGSFIKFNDCCYEFVEEIIREEEEIVDACLIAYEECNNCFDDLEGEVCNCPPLCDVFSE